MASILQKPNIFSSLLQVWADGYLHELLPKTARSRKLTGDQCIVSPLSCGPFRRALHRYVTCTVICRDELIGLPLAYQSAYEAV